MSHTTKYSFKIGQHPKTNIFNIPAAKQKSTDQDKDDKLLTSNQTKGLIEINECKNI